MIALIFAVTLTGVYFLIRLIVNSKRFEKLAKLQNKRFNLYRSTDYLNNNDDRDK